jgi:hypothetical protein
MSRLYDPMPGDEPATPSPCREAARGLITCPDCRREVSRRAAECVHCGRPDPADRIRCFQKWVLGGIVAIMVVSLVAWGGARRPGDVPTSTAWAEALRERPEGCGFLGVMMREPCEISFVAPDSPAKHADLHPGDRITAIDGRRVAHFRDYLSAIWAKRPGDRITLTITRGTTWTIDVVLSRHPND